MPVEEASPAPPAGGLGDAAARGAGIVMSTQALRVLLQFLSVVVLARLLTPEQFGLVAMVTAVIGIAEFIRDAGLSSAAIQSATLSEDERTNLFWANLALGTACAVVAAALTPVIVAGYGEPRLAPIVLALAGVFVISGANTQYRSDLIRRLRLRQLAMADLGAQALAIVVAVGLALAGAGLWAIVAMQIVTAVTAFTVNVVNVRWRPGRPVRGVDLRRFFRFGGGVLGTHGLAYVSKSVASVAIGVSLGAAPLGLFNRAYQLLMTPLQQIDAPMTSVILPVLSRVKDDDEAFERYVGKVQLMSCYVTATVLAVAAGLARPLTLVLFGQRWIELVPIFAVLAVGGVFRTIGTLPYWVFLARARTGVQLRQDLVARPIMILMMIVGLHWGVVGVAVGHSLGFFCYWLVALAVVGRAARIQVRPLLVTVGRVVCLVSLPAGLLAYLVTVELHAAPLLELLAGGAVSLAYVVAATSGLPPLREDFRTGRDLVRRALGRARPAAPARPSPTAAR